MYTLDTNALIYHLRDDERVRFFIGEVATSATPAYLSVITETELLRWPKLPPQEETAIFELLPAFSIIPLESSLARKAGVIGRMYNLKLADSIIAATALFTGTTLVTRNVRDFKRVPTLEVRKI